jgi:hypothetical protein
MSKERSSAKDKADYWFSKYIRLRDQRCVVSHVGIVKEDGVSMAETCGHLFRRGNDITRFREDLAFGLSAEINGRDEDIENPKLTIWFIKKFGEDIYNQAHILSNTIAKYNKFDFIDISNTYKKKYKNLLKNCLQNKNYVL